MSKQFLRPLFLLAATALMVAPFQNCGNSLNGFESNSSVSSASLEVFQDPEDEKDPHPVVKEKLVTTYEPILADRYYLRSLLTDVFGPSALTVDSTRTYVNALDHGAPCSLYKDQKIYRASTKTWVTADAMEICSRGSANFLVARVNPKPTITRQSLLTHACSDLTTNNTTMNFVLKRISTSAVPARTQANVLKLFHLFYRHRPAPHQGLIDSILVMLPASGVTRDHWRVAVNTVCASSHWQVL